MEFADYFRLEVERSKISKDVTGVDSIRMQLEASFDDATSSLSEFTKLKAGTCFKFPCDNFITKIIVRLVKDTGDVRVILGEGAIDDLEAFVKKDDVTKTVSTSVHTLGSSGCRIAKIVFKTEYRQMFSDMPRGMGHEEKAQRQDSNHRVLPSFRFKNLSRKVNWNKIKGINLDRIVRIRGIL